jgi:hypothetical protein
MQYVSLSSKHSFNELRGRLGSAVIHLRRIHVCTRTVPRRSRLAIEIHAQITHTYIHTHTHIRYILSSYTHTRPSNTRAHASPTDRPSLPSPHHSARPRMRLSVSPHSHSVRTCTAAPPRRRRLGGCSAVTVCVCVHVLRVCVKRSLRREYLSASVRRDVEDDGLMRQGVARLFLI